MKKYILASAATAMMLMASCSSDEPLTGPATGGNVNFTVDLPGSIQSRAYSDGTTATGLSYELYDEDGAQVASLGGTTTFTDLKATVNLSLVTGKTYTIVFWADAPGNNHYTFDKVNGKITVAWIGDSQDESRDAFFANYTFTVNGPISETIKLTRPFAQLNIGTNDLAAFNAGGGSISHSGLKVKAYNTLNLLDGSVEGDMVEYTFANAAHPAGESFPVAGYDYLVMDYILIGTDKEVVDLAWTSDNANAAEVAFTAIPVQRNYRTNIYGALLTNPAQFNVEIKPGMDGDINQEQVAWGGDATEDDLKALIAAGGTIAIQKAVNKIDLSDYTTEKPLTLILEAPVAQMQLKDFAENQPLTIKVAKNVAYPAFVDLKYKVASNITLEGDLSSTVKCGQIRLHSMGQGVENVTIKNVPFDGSLMTESNGSGIIADRYIVDNLLVEGCTFTNMKYPALYSNKDAKMNADGTVVEPPHGTIIVRDCTIEMAEDAVNSSNGLYLLTANNVTVTGCTIKNSPYHGIFARGYASSTISDNTIINAKEDGIKIEAQDGNWAATPESVTVTGNTIQSKGNGIRVKMTGVFAQAATITGNTIDMSKCNEPNDGEPCAILLVAKNESVQPMLTVAGNKLTAGTLPENYWFSLSGFTPAEGSNYATPFVTE